MAATGGMLDGISVLVIDDHEDNRFLTQRTLTEAGARVEEAESGIEGYCKALCGTYSLILLDVRLPDLDGNTLARRLRGAGYREPIIALTAAAMAGDRERGLAAGQDDYLTKPITAKALVEAVARQARR